jgi:hypothetical protein
MFSGLLCKYIAVTLAADAAFTNHKRGFESMCVDDQVNFVPSYTQHSREDDPPFPPKTRTTDGQMIFLLFVTFSHGVSDSSVRAFSPHFR